MPDSINEHEHDIGVGDELKQRSQYESRAIPQYIALVLEASFRGPMK